MSAGEANPYDPTTAPQAADVPPAALEDPRVLRIVREYLAALEAGDRPDRKELLARHPEIAAELAECLEALEFVQHAAPQLQPDDVAPGDGLGPATVLGDFRVLREVGRGGMGVVYEAEQQSLRRRVALKVLPFAAALDAKQLQRFKNEAHAAAHLHHQNIVPVHGVGSDRGVHYYAMQFIDGRTLAAVIAELRQQAGLDAPESPATPSAATRPGEPPTQPAARSGGPHHGAAFFRMAAQLGVQAAEALQHAHELGVVHRDVKPANLLVDARGKVWVTDFGLARLQDDCGLTLTGDVLGTLRYMSPEQALGQRDRVDHRTDVYALGVTLYELLALRPAFPGDSRQDVLRRVASEDPPPPRRLNPAIPAELETIVLKATAKQPEERYATAQELADDLRRWLDDRPIRARRPTWLQRLRKWVRRHRTAVNAVVVSTVAALAASTGLLAWSEGRTRDALKVADARREEAEQARSATEQTLTDMDTAFGLAEAERGHPDLGVLWFADAARQAHRDPEREQANRVRLRTWGRLLPTPVLAAAHPECRELAFHPAGDYLMALDRADRCTVWRLGQDGPLPFPGDRDVFAAAWSPDGAWLALGTADAVEVLAFPGGEPVCRIPRPGPVRSVAFGPDGNLLAAGGDGARVWDRRTRGFVGAELPHPRPVVRLAFNRRGDRLATACADGTARVFDVPGGPTARLGPVPALGWSGRADLPIAPVFIDNDRGLLTRGRDAVVWWDADNGKEVRRLADTANVFLVLPDPGGRFFVVGDGSASRCWDVSSARPAGTAMRQHHQVVEAALSGDGRVLLTTSSDRTACLWAVPAGTPLGPPLRHQDSVQRAAFSADGRFFATAQQDGFVRAWHVPEGRSHDRRLEAADRQTGLKVSRDGRCVLATGTNRLYESDLRSTRVCDAVTGRPAGPTLEAGGVLADADLSPDGLRAVTVSSPAADQGPADAAGQLRIWEVATGRRLADLVALPPRPRAVAWAPTGHLLAALCQGGEAALIDADSGQVLRRLRHEFAEPAGDGHCGVTWTADGRRFVTWGPDVTVQVWDAATGERCFPPLRHGGHCRAAAVSADGRWLVTAAYDRTARVWGLEDGRPVAEPLAHPDWVFAACFSPDGRQVLTACRDGCARLWDWREGRLVCPPFRRAGECYDASLTPDGRWVLSGGSDGAAHAWEWRTGRPVMPPALLGDALFSVQPAAGGRRAVLAGTGPGLLAVDLTDLEAPADLDADDLVPWGELLSGCRVVGGEVAGLTTQDWLARWQAFQARHPHYGWDPAKGALAWHRRQAVGCEAARDWQGVVAHLDRLLAAEPGQWDWRLRRARALAELGRWEAALADSTLVVAARPDDPDARFDLGRSHNGTSYNELRAGRWAAAVAHDRQGIEILGRLAAEVPTDPDVRRELASSHNLLAWALVGRPDWTPEGAAEALAAARKAVEMQPDSGGCWNTLGIARYRSGDCAGAVAALEKARALTGSGWASTRFFLAMAHWRLGDGEEARRWYDQAVAAAEKEAPEDEELRRYRAEAAALLGRTSQP